MSCPKRFPWCNAYLLVLINDLYDHKQRLYAYQSASCFNFYRKHLHSCTFTAENSLSYATSDFKLPRPSILNYCIIYLTMQLCPEDSQFCIETQHIYMELYGLYLVCDGFSSHKVAWDIQLFSVK